MNRYTTYVGAYVSSDGSYSAQSQVVVFEQGLLSDNQWEILEELHESDRYAYAAAIATGDSATAIRIEEQS
jgi:hypothetical protein